MPSAIGALSAGGISLSAAIAHDYLSGKYDDLKIKKIIDDVAEEVADEYDLHVAGVNPLKVMVESDDLGAKANEYKHGKRYVSIEELESQLETVWKNHADDRYFEKDGEEIIKEYFRQLNRRLVADTEAYRVILFDYIVAIKEEGNESVADDFKSIQETINEINNLLEDVKKRIENLRETADIESDIADKLAEVNKIIDQSTSGNITKEELRSRIRDVGLKDSVTNDLISIIESALQLDRKTMYADIDKLGTELGPPRSRQDYGWGQTPKEAILSVIQKQVAFSPYGTEIQSDDPDDLLSTRRGDLPHINWQDIETNGSFNSLDDRLDISVEYIEQTDGSEIIRIKIENIWVRTGYMSGSADVKFKVAITAPSNQYESADGLHNWVGLGWKAERVSTEPN